MLLPDRSELARFVAALFCRADHDSFVSMRAFYDHKDGFALYPDWQTVRVTGNDDDIVDAAEDLAGLAALNGEAIVFAPPIATFNNRDKADEASVANGLVISVELDSNPAAGRQRLEGVLGTATIVMESGRLWPDPRTDELVPKLHLHWRLPAPTRTKIEHDFLKEANRLATILAGGDPSGVPLVHPLRWAGSVHRKAEPRLARIIEFHPEVEISWQEAHSKLKAAVEAEGKAAAPGSARGSFNFTRSGVRSEIMDIAAAVAVIPNDDSDDPPGTSRKEWNDMGLRIHAATGGSEAGYALFLDWSQRSTKKFTGKHIRKVWESFGKCPPGRTGAGALFKRARAACPWFVRPSEYRLRVERDASQAEFEARQPPPDGTDPQSAVSGGAEELSPWEEQHPFPNPDDPVPGPIPEPPPAIPTGTPGVGVNLLDFYALMTQHKYIWAPARELWPAISVDARIPPIPLLDPGGNPILYKKGRHKGEPIEITPSEWLDKHQPVEQVTWAPGEDMVVRNRLISEGGWIKRRRVSCFNLYRPPVLGRGDRRKAGRWLRHVLRIYPDKAEAWHIIRWLAHRVQHPAEKINHALVLGGEQGIGKDTIVEPVKRAVGPWNVHEESPRTVLERQFNGYLKGVILRISEARDLGEAERHTFYEHMKAIIVAPPDVLRINEKNIREYYIPNVVGVIITTNHKTDGIYLPDDDRRHYVAWSPRRRGEFSEQYFIDFYRWLDTGGDRHVAAYLESLDLSGFNPKAPPPQTHAFWDMVSANRVPEDAELADQLDLLNNPDVVTIARIINSTRDCYGNLSEFGEWLKDRRNRRKIPHRMETCGYVVVPNPEADDGIWKISGVRHVVYGKASLTSAARLRAARKFASGR
jgi:hypothetical protein